VQRSQSHSTGSHQQQQHTRRGLASAGGSDGSIGGIAAAGSSGGCGSSSSPASPTGSSGGSSRLGLGLPSPASFRSRFAGLSASESSGGEGLGVKWDDAAVAAAVSKMVKKMVDDVCYQCGVSGLLQQPQ
jgi:hypothetical protein